MESAEDRAVRVRTKSIITSIGAGAVLGVIALVARYTPDPFQKRAQPASASSAPLPVAQAATNANNARVPSLLPASARPFSPIPRAARFDADPAARAACPAGMALVDGDF